MVGNVHEADDGKVYVAGGELLVVRAAESATASGGEVAETAQTHHPCKTCIRAPASRITPVPYRHKKCCRGVHTIVTS